MKMENQIAPYADAWLAANGFRFQLLLHLRARTMLDIFVERSVMKGGYHKNKIILQEIQKIKINNAQSLGY